ncbi:MAG: helix-turn-helix transcriptional regulator [Legionellales bacterium]
MNNIGYFTKDKDSKYLKASDNIANLFGFKTIESLEGKSDYELCPMFARFADECINHDTEIITNRTRDAKLRIYNDNDDIRIFLIDKKLVKTNSTFIIEGLKLELTKDKFVRTLVHGMNANAINLHYHHIMFSNRQSECLYYLLRGKTAPEIAQILSLSKRTVESYIEHIKYKMNVYNKSELIEKSFSLYYQNVIPISILQKNFSAE